ncbi:vWA domain-containing protein [Megasphaera sp. AM44-1BH]|uniref:vWA domain-containing protein n=1 Tax=Megasphaera sp. AM44-1BH TaxID=2292358 RepID=UPI0013140287|nr:vWA domain-containing protein [Megasphaera sp. AM44-1BH]
MMKQHLKIMAALACLMGLGSTAVMAANWTDTLQQLAKSVPAVGQVLKGTEIQTTVPGIAATTETTTTQSGTEPAGTAKPAVQASHLEVVLLIDKSGSMKGLEEDTVKGYNSMLAKERQLSVPTNVTTILFSSDHEILADRKPISEVPDMTLDSYKVRGATALYDTIGDAIEKTEAVKGIDDTGSKVLFVIITDGLENYSQTYDQEKVRKLIDAQEEKGWEFVFIGANMDAEKEADTIGIKKENAATYENSEKGVQANYQAVSQMVHSLAATSSLVGSPWKNSIVPGK